MDPKICAVSDDVKQILKKFRLRKEKNIAALILKIDREKQIVQLDEEYQDTSIDEVREELSPHTPRFVVLSYVYHHDDGRVSYPLCLIFFSPEGANLELMMMYTGTVREVENVLGLTKRFEIRDLDELQEDWLKEKLAFFR